MSYHGGDTIHSEELPWLPLAPSVGVRVLKVDRDTGEFSVMIRAEPGGLLPPHKHLASAEIFVLKGEGVHAQTGPYREGDYITEPKDAVHDALPFDRETVLLMVCKGPSAFLGPNGEVQHIMDVPMLEGLSAAYSATA